MRVGLSCPVFLVLMAALASCQPAARDDGGGSKVADTAAAAPAGSPDSDARAVELARRVMDKLGGREAWDGTRYVRWKFFGGRMHYWDRHTGDIRIESPERERDGEVLMPETLILMNIDSRKGRVWQEGRPVEDPAKIAELLDTGHQWWVNDSYWMFMPYKLLDPGVTLTYSGERTLDDGRVGEVIEMTFAGDLGYTPENRYEIFVGRDTGHVEEWTFYAEADQTEANFTMPWDDWRQFGNIWLATSHGRGLDWQIAVFDELDRSVFSDPAPVAP